MFSINGQRCHSRKSQNKCPEAAWKESRHYHDSLMAQLSWSASSSSCVRRVGRIFSGALRIRIHCREGPVNDGFDSEVK
jgi:hypothetical protein